MPNFARDVDIGRPNLSSPVDVQNFAPVLAALQEATAKIEEAVEELRKVTLGTGLITGTNLDEEAT